MKLDIYKQINKCVCLKHILRNVSNSQARQEKESKLNINECTNENTQKIKGEHNIHEQMNANTLVSNKQR